MVQNVYEFMELCIGKIRGYKEIMKLEELSDL